MFHYDSADSFISKVNLLLIWGFFQSKRKPGKVLPINGWLNCKKTYMVPNLSIRLLLLFAITGHIHMNNAHFDFFFFLLFCTEQAAVSRGISACVV